MGIHILYISITYLSDAVLLLLVLSSTAYGIEVLLVILGYNFAFHYLVAFVEFLLRSLPSIVCPKIVWWVLPDGLFQHLEEASCDFVFRKGVRLTGDKFVGGCVVAPFRSGHLYIEHRIVHLSHDALASSKYWGLRVIEER